VKTAYCNWGNPAGGRRHPSRVRVSNGSTGKEKENEKLWKSYKNCRITEKHGLLNRRNV